MVILVRWPDENPRNDRHSCKVQLLAVLDDEDPAGHRHRRYWA